MGVNQEKVWEKNPIIFKDDFPILHEYDNSWTILMVIIIFCNNFQVSGTKYK